MSATHECPGDGRLRAYLDGQLSDAERLAVETHLGGCQPCEQRLQAIAARSAYVCRVLAQPTPPPDVSQAWRRLQGRIPGTRHSTFIGRLTAMWRSLHARTHAALLSAASITLVAAVALVPPLRTAAAGVLDIFRVQHLKVISYDPAKAPSLTSFNDSVFSRTEIDEAEPQPVTTAAEAALLAGYAVRVPTWLPEGFSLEEFTVTPTRQGYAQVNVPQVRLLLEAAGLPTDMLPSDPDDASIYATIQPVVVLRYGDGDHHLSVQQSTSPEVSIPAGMDLTRLGSLGLQLLGMWPEEADRVSASIDWANTLVIPLPSDATQAREISVNGNPGYLLEGEDDDSGAMWQEGALFYAVTGDLKETQLMQVAESLR